MRRSLLALLLLAGCVRGVSPSGTHSLLGLTLPLLSSPSLRLAAGARLDGGPAIVSFEPGTQLSLVSRGCGGLVLLPAKVELADPFGSPKVLQLVRIDGLDLGPARLAPFEAGLIEGATCTVSLGDDVLGGLALEVGVAARELRVAASASKEAWLAAMPRGDEVQVVAVSRDPKHDWPLVALRIAQGEASFTGPLLFSAGEPRTRIFEAKARAAGLKPGLELLDGLPLPEGLGLPKALSALRGFAVDRVEFSPGVGVEDVTVDLEPGDAPHAALGVLGTDVWGRFDAVVDLAKGLIVLHRPRMLKSGSRIQCERDGRVGEEACFEVTQRVVPGGTVVGMATWRPLPEGGRISFDFLGADPPCRVGFSFPRTDRGTSTLHQLPWARLREVLPTCASSIAAASKVEPGLFQEGPLEECHGVCAYAQDISTARVTCECQPVRGNLDEGAQRELLQLYRSLLEKARQTREVEPDDP
jgi:hypothetical protein